MNELKIDLLNKFYQQKYFAELEIVRLSGVENQLNYAVVINKITKQLDKLNKINARIDLIKKLYEISDADDQFANDSNKQPE